MCITTEGQIWIRPEQERKIRTRVKCASVHSITGRTGAGLVLVKNNTTALGPKEVSIQPTAPQLQPRYTAQRQRCVEKKTSSALLVVMGRGLSPRCPRQRNQEVRCPHTSWKMESPSETPSAQRKKIGLQNWDFVFKTFQLHRVQPQEVFPSFAELFEVLTSKSQNP